MPSAFSIRYPLRYCGNGEPTGKSSPAFAMTHFPDGRVRPDRGEQLLLPVDPRVLIERDRHALRPRALAEGVGVQHVDDDTVVLGLCANHVVEREDEVLPVRVARVHRRRSRPPNRGARAAAVEDSVLVVIEHQVHVFSDLHGAVRVAAVGHGHEEGQPVLRRGDPRQREPGEQFRGGAPGQDGLRFCGPRTSPTITRSNAALSCAMSSLFLSEPEGKSRAAGNGLVTARRGLGGARRAAEGHEQSQRGQQLRRRFGAPSQ